MAGRGELELNSNLKSNKSFYSFPKILGFNNPFFSIFGRGYIYILYREEVKESAPPFKHVIFSFLNRKTTKNCAFHGFFLQCSKLMTEHCFAT